eukprot:4243329-Amphidinium_carterae.1
MRTTLNGDPLVSKCHESVCNIIQSSSPLRRSACKKDLGVTLQSGQGHALHFTQAYGRTGGKGSRTATNPRTVCAIASRSRRCDKNSTKRIELQRNGSFVLSWFG